MKYKLSKKAFEIDFSKIEEGYLYDSSSFITYAENRNKAKSELLRMAYCENICLTGEDEELTYLTIPVIRCKEADKYFFEDKEMTLLSIDRELRERKRISDLDEILNNKHIKYCYIVKNGYYRPNNCGYTDFKHRAGVYSKEEAVSSAKSCSDIRIMRIDINEHNQMINDEINELKTRLLEQH